MIIIAAWKNKNSGIGHYSRAKRYFNFLKKIKILVLAIIQEQKDILIF